MSVVDAVFAFDGKHVADLKAAAAEFEASEADDLVALCAADAHATRVAATWIVKALCEADRSDSLDLAAIFARIADESDWEPLLHLLQSVQFAPDTTTGQMDAIAAHVGHPKTLVRVWAMDAFVQTAIASGQRLDEARSMVNTALSAGKASQRARARQLAPLLGL